MCAHCSDESHDAWFDRGMHFDPCRIQILGNVRRLRRGQVLQQLRPVRRGNFFNGMSQEFRAIVRIVRYIARLRCSRPPRRRIARRTRIGRSSIGPIFNRRVAHFEIRIRSIASQPSFVDIALMFRSRHFNFIGSLAR